MKSRMKLGTLLRFLFRILKYILNWLVANSIKLIELILREPSKSVCYLMKFFILELLFSHRSCKKRKARFKIITKDRFKRSSFWSSSS